MYVFKKIKICDLGLLNIRYWLDKLASTVDKLCTIIALFLDFKPRPLQSAPVIPVPQNSAWLDLLFPAHVQNPERAMSYLTSEITEKTKDVEVKLRPDNPSCIPLRTCVQPAVKLILK